VCEINGKGSSLGAKKVMTTPKKKELRPTSLGYRKYKGINDNLPEFPEGGRKKGKHQRTKECP